MVKDSDHLHVLLAHGSYDPKWCDLFVALYKKVHQLRSNTALAYFEMAEPRLEMVIENAYKQGYRQFWIHPLFLSAGKHWHVDLPKKMEHFRVNFSASEFTLLPVIGENPLVFDAIFKAIASNCEQIDNQ